MTFKKNYTVLTFLQPVKAIISRANTIREAICRWIRGYNDDCRWVGETTV